MVKVVEVDDGQNCTQIKRKISIRAPGLRLRAGLALALHEHGLERCAARQVADDLVLVHRSVRAAATHHCGRYHRQGEIDHKKIHALLEYQPSSCERPTARDCTGSTDGTERERHWALNLAVAYAAREYACIPLRFARQSQLTLTSSPLAPAVLRGEASAAALEDDRASCSFFTLAEKSATALGCRPASASAVGGLLLLPPPSFLDESRLARDVNGAAAAGAGAPSSPNRVAAGLVGGGEARSRGDAEERVSCSCFARATSRAALTTRTTPPRSAPRSGARLGWGALLVARGLGPTLALPLALAVRANQPADRVRSTRHGGGRCCGTGDAAAL